MENEIDRQMQQMEQDREFLWNCNKATEFMDEASQARVREIANNYKWTDSRGEQKSILSADETNNLSIPRGTLTLEERNIINHHVTSRLQQRKESSINFLLL